MWFFSFKCFSFQLYTLHQILSSLAEDSFACWKWWQIMSLKLLFKKLLIQCIFLSQSLISSFQNFTSFLLQLHLSKGLEYFYLNHLTFPWEIFALRNSESRDNFVTDLIYKVDIMAQTLYLLKKQCKVKKQQCNFSLTTEHKIAVRVKNIEVFTSKQCHIHKCLIETWKWMAQLSFWSVWISSVIEALNNLKTYVLL